VTSLVTVITSASCARGVHREGSVGGLKLRPTDYRLKTHTHAVICLSVLRPGRQGASHMCTRSRSP